MSLLSTSVSLNSTPVRLNWLRLLAVSLYTEVYSTSTQISLFNQPRSQGLFPQAREKGPGDEVAF